LADAIDEFTNSSFGARAAAFVRGVRVNATHLNYKKTVKTISNQTAKQYSFHVDEYKATLTVEQYFKRSEFLPD